MNERIKELWLEGAQSLWPRPGKCTAGEYDYNLEKFAELIVAECLELTLGKDRKQLLDKGDLNGANLVQKDIIRVIKHFGVEE